MKQSTEDSGPHMVPFAVFGLIAYPLFYFINHIFFKKYLYDTSMLRVLICGLCFLLALKNIWPPQIKKILPIFWYFTLLINFPFFVTFMLVKNEFSGGWILNTLSIYIILLLLTDWKSYLALLALGITAGFTFGYINNHNLLVFHPTAIDQLDFLNTFSISVIMGVIFSRNKAITEQEKIDTMRTLGASIGHELRRPLTTILTSSKALLEFIPKLIENYEKTDRLHINLHRIRPHQLKSIITSAENIQAEMYLANSLIDMLLLKVNQIKPKFGEPEKLSIENSVTNALARYPYPSKKHRQLVHFNCAHDFIFLGREILVEHVIFNLLKNSMYAIETINKGEIYISTSADNDYNYLFFKDTATGISSYDKRFLFSRFFSTTRHGTGLGLAFCKLVMEYYNGYISCHSIYGEFTEFKLAFKKIKDSNLRQTIKLAIC